MRLDSEPLAGTMAKISSPFSMVVCSEDVILILELLVPILLLQGGGDLRVKPT